MEKKIYFAGKIRHEFTSEGEPTDCGDYYYDWRESVLVDSEKNKSHLLFSYGGPDYSVEHGMVYGGGGGSHQDVYFENIENIQNCDIVFAYINTNDCYGTIAEIGYANGIGKKVFLCHTPNITFEDFWFVFSFADTVVEVKNANEGWSKFEKQVLGHFNYKEYLKSEYRLELSKECKAESGGKCKLCGSKKFLNVHHNSYQNLGKKNLEKQDLIVLCNSCHKKFHDILPDKK